MNDENVIEQVGRYRVVLVPDRSPAEPCADGKAYVEGDVYSWVIQYNRNWLADDDPDLTMVTWEDKDTGEGYYGAACAEERAREKLDSFLGHLKHRICKVCGQRVEPEWAGEDVPASWVHASIDRSHDAEVAGTGPEPAWAYLVDDDPDYETHYNKGIFSRLDKARAYINRQGPVRWHKSGMSARARNGSLYGISPMIMDGLDEDE